MIKQRFWFGWFMDFFDIVDCDILYHRVKKITAGIVETVLNSNYHHSKIVEHLSASL